MMDGPLPRPGGGCFANMIIAVVFLICAAVAVLTVLWPADWPDPRCGCSSSECPFQPKAVPSSDQAKMYYWSIE